MARICIFGAASEFIPQEYKDSVEELGYLLGKAGHTLVFGGGSTGLMGAAARGFTKAGAETFGVAPLWMQNNEPLFNCTRFVGFEDMTMSQRKTVMKENAEAFVILPGGIGTSDEAHEVITERELRQLDAPIIMYNPYGFWDKDNEGFQQKVNSGFIKRTTASLVTSANTPEKAVAEVAKQLDIKRASQAIDKKIQPIIDEMMMDKEIANREGHLVRHVVHNALSYLAETGNLETLNPRQFVMHCMNTLEEKWDSYSMDPDVRADAMQQGVKANYTGDAIASYADKYMVYAFWHNPNLNVRSLIEQCAAVEIEAQKYAEVMRQLGYEERLIDSVVPKAVKWLQQTQFAPIDPVEFVHRVVDDVYQDWMTYKNESYDGYCQAFPGTTTEEYFAENEDRLDSDFFAALNIKNLIEWEADMDNEEQMRLMNEEQEEGEPYRNGSGHPKHPGEGDIGDVEW